MKQLSFPFRGIEDLPLPRLDHWFAGIDGYIVPLVKALTHFGVRTTHSCQGHYPFQNYIQPQHPEVSIYCPESNIPCWHDKEQYLERAGALEVLLHQYNQTQPRVPWIKVRDTLRPALEAKSEEGLWLLQEEANRLAHYIFARS